MGDRIAIELDHLPEDLQAVTKVIERSALSRRGDELALLELLRLLEQLHTYIRDEWFQEAMPTNRQRLYALLKDIEIGGGWPYIQRMRLRSLLEKLELEERDAQEERTDIP
ncbi:MAG: hypothetical protein F6J95_021010 [Leptolyngbya sp. SIO1E4]|nr:hypothetical protein [Leptolyngbya sp. SIO1E4]